MVFQGLLGEIVYTYISVCSPLVIICVEQYHEESANVHNAFQPKYAKNFPTKTCLGAYLVTDIEEDKIKYQVENCT